MEYLFFLVKECPTGGLITELCDEDDIGVYSSVDLSRNCNIFYTKLYISPPHDAQGEDCHAKLLSQILNKFSLVARKALEVPITEVDLTTVVQFRHWQKARV
jgi:hypothetical protein